MSMNTGVLSIVSISINNLTKHLVDFLTGLSSSPILIASSLALYCFSFGCSFVLILHDTN